jgi:hypothetical protein
MLGAASLALNLRAENAEKMELYFVDNTGVPAGRGTDGRAIPHGWQKPTQSDGIAAFPATFQAQKVESEREE